MRIWYVRNLCKRVWESHLICNDHVYIILQTNYLCILLLIGLSRNMIRKSPFAVCFLHLWSRNVRLMGLTSNGLLFNRNAIVAFVWTKNILWIFWLWTLSHCFITRSTMCLQEPQRLCPHEFLLWYASSN